MSSTHLTTRRLRSALVLVVSLALLGPTWAAESTGTPETGEEKLLRIVSTGTPDAIRQEYGLDADVIQKIMAYRESGKKIQSIMDFVEASGLETAKALALAENAKPGNAKVAPAGPEARKRMKAMPSGTAAPSESDKEALGISNIRPGFYGKLPGYEDLDKLDPELKKEFLERMNYEKCPCGCENETLAFCIVNDPGCPVVKARAKKIYDEVVSKADPKKSEE